MSARPVGVLVMAYGTPRTPDEIEPYYTDIRRGRPPSPEALADLVARYAAIGGVSPLAELTEAQAAAIQQALDALVPATYSVSVGLKHADPRVEAAAADLARTSEMIVGVVLAPHFSAFSVGQYLARARAGAASVSPDVPVAGVESWATEPAYVSFLASDLERRVARMRTAHGERVRVLFTAHSLPRRILDSGDPYPAELRSTAEAVADRAGLAEHTDWRLAWQSAGRTPEPWLGPDVLDVIDEVAGDVEGVIVCPCGFVADHLEVLYDLDIEARARAEATGLAFDRTASVNAEPAVMAALARRVHQLATVQRSAG